MKLKIRVELITSNNDQLWKLLDAIRDASDHPSRNLKMVYSIDDGETTTRTFV